MRIRRLLEWGLVLVAYVLVGNLVCSIMSVGLVNDLAAMGSRLDKARHDPLLPYTHMSASAIEFSKQFALISGVYAALGIAGTIAIGWFIYRYLIRGCTALSEGAQRLAEGELDYRIAYAANNELGAVAAAFNQMADRLAAAEGETRKQQDLAESLLLNVLPAEVANELKQKGAVDPRYHEDVTILFTDFQGFTLSTEKLAAEELVKALHDYFTAFDNVVQSYGLEKLKTIGDSYMCVAGLPERRASHAVDAVLAAFEIVAEVRRGHGKGLPPWSIRVGVHTGPVVSGVVGIRKFAFDIWGESVNFASRMESSGLPNRVNLSASTFTRVKDFFDCEYRGKVPTKEGRDFDMYFALGALPAFSESGDVPRAFGTRYRTYFQRELATFPRSLITA